MVQKASFIGDNQVVKNLPFQHFSQIDDEKAQIIQKERNRMEVVNEKKREQTIKEKTHLTQMANLNLLNET